MTRDWRDFAECTLADPERFDPPERSQPKDWQLAAADATIRAYCTPCPVSAHCAAMGSRRNATGIWGGELFTIDYTNVSHGHGPRIKVEVA